MASPTNGELINLAMMPTSDLKMWGELTPGELFWTTECGAGHAWFTCIYVHHREDAQGVPYAKVGFLAPEGCQFVERSFRYAKEVCTP